ncbi:hypothetical protein UCRPC4_g01275 [Phaeomoniella chlamydospora]|uniref:Phosphatidylethanolamine-binding protein n=1 Tax=Phaeomoniella chlamydospora TaxID=158046 RepID=A0A0G2HEZ8_PHACM|nr:hypothetical protein UCRPC4_g01275 [Phaeomoniella chlamydospora]
MAITDYIEWALAKALYSSRGHDAGIFTRTPPFKDIPENLTITSPDNGPSGSKLKPEFTQVGPDRFPTLTWIPPSDIQIAEYILICEDVDAPLPQPIVHGLFWGIPGTVTKVTDEDIQLKNLAEGKQGGIKAGWVIGRNRKGTHYFGAKPLLEHGTHRYFFEVVALEDKIERDELEKDLEENMTKEELVKRIDGKVVGWGNWVGEFERRWGEKH